jgi:hypothetical protein
MTEAFLVQSVEEYSLLSCNATQFGERQKFRRNISLPSSKSKSMSSNKLAEIDPEDRGNMFLRNDGLSNDRCEEWRSSALVTLEKDVSLSSRVHNLVKSFA